MLPTYQLLLTLGAILLLGLVTSTLGHRTFLPRVTLLLIFGAVLGKQGLDLIPPVFHQWFEIIANMTLVMVGFLLGGKLTSASLGKSVGKALWISICAAIMTTMVVALALLMVGAPEELAVLLGCIAAATAPAAVFDVVSESPRKGPFTRLLLSIVALDDAWALILFGLGIAIVSSLNNNVVEHSSFIAALWEIGGAVMLGLAIGLPAAYLTGRLKPGQPVLSEALGLVFICGGLALWLDVSFLIASMVLGAVISNLARHHEYPFHEIEGIEPQFMVVFFVLAGASLEFSALTGIGLVGITYIVARIIGKLAGASIGGKLSGVDKTTRNWTGIALLPQAGVAIGMALVASNYFPEYRQILLPVVISTTILFEIIGPVFTRLAVRRSVS